MGTSLLVEVIPPPWLIEVLEELLSELDLVKGELLGVEVGVPTELLANVWPVDVILRGLLVAMGVGDESALDDMLVEVGLMLDVDVFAPVELVIAVEELDEWVCTNEGLEELVFTEEELKELVVTEEELDGLLIAVEELGTLEDDELVLELILELELLLITFLILPQLPLLSVY